MEAHWQRQAPHPSARSVATHRLGALACGSAVALGTVHFGVNTWLFLGEGALGVGDLALYLGYVVG